MYVHFRAPGPGTVGPVPGRAEWCALSSNLWSQLPLHSTEQEAAIFNFSEASSELLREHRRGTLGVSPVTSTTKIALLAERAGMEHISYEESLTLTPYISPFRR